MKLEEFIYQLEKIQNENLTIETTVYGMQSGYVIAWTDDTTKEYKFEIGNERNYEWILSELREFQNELKQVSLLTDFLESQKIKVNQNQFELDELPDLDTFLDFYEK